jgi:hypothetical protein
VDPATRQVRWSRWKKSARMSGGRTKRNVHLTSFNQQQIVIQ